MRVVIDMQGLQTPSRYRGIGRFSFSLIQEILKLNTEHEIILLFNGALSENLLDLIRFYQKIIPRENIQIWNKKNSVANMSLKKLDLLREFFIANLNPDVVLITSLFEGFGNEAVTTVKLVDNKIPVCGILYDLIPLLNKDLYFKNTEYKKFYLNKLIFLEQSDALLGISNTAKTEGEQYLNYKNEIVNISFGVNEIFKNLKLTQEQKKEVLNRYGLENSPIIYVGGSDQRKNLYRLIKAYNLQSDEHKAEYPLVFIGDIDQESQKNILKISKESTITFKNIKFLGHINDEQLIEVYNSAAFLINPSLHEGIGLPIVEAMACGLPFICSNIESFREILGDIENVFFDPYDEKAIARAIYSQIKRIKNQKYQTEVFTNIVSQFTWKNVALNTINALQKVILKKTNTSTVIEKNGKKKLAFVSPIPPEKTGIANYSEVLVKFLKDYYDITVICTDNNINQLIYKKDVKNVNWFLRKYKKFDRVLYHFGNSHFHSHMQHLLPIIPGVVVLHDFYLSNLPVLSFWNDANTGVLEREIWYSHGYLALFEWLKDKDIEYIKNKYPMNLSTLQLANGLITHSLESKKLCMTWYGENFTNHIDWEVIPLLREIMDDSSKSTVRMKYGIPEDTFLVSSFGLLDPTKLNDELLNAFLASSLTKKNKCKLVFVGENHGGEYGQQLKDLINKHKLEYDVEILGWVDDIKFNDFLLASDIAVQLRTLSRGETSSAVLSCLAAGLPTIINAHGSMQEIDSECVIKLEDKFSQEDLVGALENLKENNLLCKKLSKKARELILSEYSPNNCAKKYFDTIENVYAKSKRTHHQLVDSIISQAKYLTIEEINNYSKIIASNFPIKQPFIKKIFLDVTATFKNDLKTGIERVVRALVCELMNNSSTQIRFEPVYLCQENGSWRYRHAQTFAANIFGLTNDNLFNPYIDVQIGDKILILDNSGIDLVQSIEYLKELQCFGVEIQTVIYDLLPILLPHVFPPGTDLAHQQWLKVVLNLDGVICISEAVSEDFKKWTLEAHPSLNKNFKINWFHLGADIENSSPTTGICDIVEQVTKKMLSRKTFLVVSTIEPRKRHLQIIEAFEHLWTLGHDYQLVIVGKEGWKPLPDESRRNIPETMLKITNHSENGNRLFYLNNISDESLQKIYKASTCLILASEGEGFGLPIIEAAQYKIPLILRDIPVFKEIAKNSAFYFSGLTGEELAASIKKWLELYEKNQHPQVQQLNYLTWYQSADRIREILI
jgi:glycosyltransferase involved in cell wall biosynthesis